MIHQPKNLVRPRSPVTGPVFSTSSLEHLTYKVGALGMAMATFERRSELQALVFDSKYVKSDREGGGGARVTLYFSLEFLHINKKSTQTNDPGLFQQSNLGGNILVFQTVL